MKRILFGRYERSLADLSNPRPSPLRGDVPLYKRLRGTCYLGARIGASDFELIAEINRARRGIPPQLVDLCLDHARQRMRDECSSLFPGPICPACQQPQVIARVEW